MVQTDHWKRGDTLDKGILLELLENRFKTVDFEQVKRDVRPFIKDEQELALWSAEFFLTITKDLEVL